MTIDASEAVRVWRISSAIIAHINYAFVGYGRVGDNGQPKAAKFLGQRPSVVEMQSEGERLALMGMQTGVGTTFTASR
jgi:hypothetical protein